MNLRHKVWKWWSLPLGYLSVIEIFWKDEETRCGCHGNSGRWTHNTNIKISIVLSSNRVILLIGTQLFKNFRLQSTKQSIFLTNWRKKTMCIDVLWQLTEAGSNFIVRQALFRQALTAKHIIDAPNELVPCQNKFRRRMKLFDKLLSRLKPSCRIFRVRCCEECDDASFKDKLHRTLVTVSQTAVTDCYQDVITFYSSLVKKKTVHRGYFGRQLAKLILWWIAQYPETWQNLFFSTTSGVQQL